MTVRLFQGDSKEVLAQFDDNTFDSLVTDPPAAISLMGKEWDSNKGGRDQWIEWLRGILIEALRVLKPGAHGLIWALPRTSHYTAMAAELAGFEIRDIVHHIFGSGMPMGQNVSKAFDTKEGKGIRVKATNGKATNSTMYGSFGSGGSGEYEDILPETELARKWFGWHTALAPGAEHWILVRKPIEETNIKDNVAKHGTGALHIEATRVPRTDGYQKAWEKPVSTNVSNEGYLLSTAGKHTVDLSENQPSGGFTKNIVLSHTPDCVYKDSTTLKGSKVREDRETISDSSIYGNNRKSGSRSLGDEVIEIWECSEDCPIYQLDASGKKTQSKRSQRGKTSPHYLTHEKFNKENAWIGESTERGFSDAGGRSRYFNRFVYQAKVPRSEKRFYCKTCDAVYPFAIGRREVYLEHIDHELTPHPTPKSVQLMKWLVTLITPEHGVVLDPFFGTGSTGVACTELGVDCVGIDFEEDYLKIAKHRIQEKAA